jgi:hypothetical protein
MSVDEQPRGPDDNGKVGVRERVIDARVALMLLGEGRNRLTGRLFGVPRRDSSLLAMIGLVALADVFARRTRRLRRRPRRPTLFETLLGAAGVKEAAHRLVGPASRDVPDFGTVISLVVVVAVVRPILGPPIRSARAASRRTRAVVTGIFDGLIGHPRVRAVVAKPAATLGIDKRARAGDRS